MIQAEEAILKHKKKKKVSSNQAFGLDQEVEVSFNYLVELRLRRQNSCRVLWRDLRESVRIGPWTGGQRNASLCGMGQSCGPSLRWNNYCQLCL